MNITKSLMQRLKSVLIEMAENHNTPADEKLKALTLLVDLYKQNPPAKRARRPKPVNTGFLGTK